MVPRMKEKRRSFGVSRLDADGLLFSVVSVKRVRLIVGVLVSVDESIFCCVCFGVLSVACDVMCAEV